MVFHGVEGIEAQPVEGLMWLEIAHQRCAGTEPSGTEPSDGATYTRALSEKETCILARERQVAERAAACRFRLRRSHAAALVLRLLQRAMRFELFGQLGLPAAVANPRSQMFEHHAVSNTFWMATTSFWNSLRSSSRRRLPAAVSV